MIGMDAATGKPLSGDAHLAQSIGDILSTPIGTRTMLRDYGSALFELLDQPMNALGRVRIFAATAQAISRWERRSRLTGVALEQDAATGRFAIRLEGERTDTPATGLVRLTIPLRTSA